MATVKVVLRKKKNKNGTYPLALRITKDRKTSFIHLGYHLFPKDWDEKEQRVKKSHSNSTRLNNFIMAKVAEASDAALEAEVQKKAASSRAIKQKIKPSAGTSFFAQADLYLTNLKQSGNYNCYVADKPRVNRFREFLKGEDVAFSDINTGLLNRFKVYLKSKYKISERTVSNYLIVIRSIFSQAIKEGVTEEKYYPFGKGKVSIKIPESTKVGISKKDVENLEKVKLPTLAADEARDAWLVSFYFAGMRISDLLRLRWSDFHDLRLHYTMGKNDKPGSLKTPEKALRILAKYELFKRHDDDFIFSGLKSLPELDDDFLVKRRIAHVTNRYDKQLRTVVAPAAGIKTKISMHIARHTFASLAGDKIPIQMLQKLYRHSNITTTIGYQANFIYRDADDALDKVLGS